MVVIWGGLIVLVHSVIFPADFTEVTYQVLFEPNREAIKPPVQVNIHSHNIFKAMYICTIEFFGDEKPSKTVNDSPY